MFGKYLFRERTDIFGAACLAEDTEYIILKSKNTGVFRRIGVVCLIGHMPFSDESP